MKIVWVTMQRTEECQTLDAKLKHMELTIQSRTEDNVALVEQGESERRRVADKLEQLEKDNEKLQRQLREQKMVNENAIAELKKTKDAEIEDLTNKINGMRKTVQEASELKASFQNLEKENHQWKIEIRRVKDENFMALMALKKEHEEELKSQEENLIQGFTNEKEAILKSTDDNMSKVGSSRHFTLTFHRKPYMQ